MTTVPAEPAEVAEADRLQRVAREHMRAARKHRRRAKECLGQLEALIAAAAQRGIHINVNQMPTNPPRPTVGGPSGNADQRTHQAHER